MSIKSKLLFILIGDDKHGKTTLQKYLIEKICEVGWYEKLPTKCTLKSNASTGIFHTAIAVIKRKRLNTITR